MNEAAPRFDRVLSDERWKAAFGRRETVEQVMQYVVDHWNDLQRNPAQDLRFSKPEPKITAYFGQWLFKNARAHGVSGLFQIEAPLADIDELRQELVARGRSDIRCYSDRSDPPLDFVLEFKKMKLHPGGNQSRLNYCRDGVLRFVNGIYARETDFGFMVGLVAQAEHAQPVAAALVRSIQRPDMVQQLRMIKAEDGSAVSTDPLMFRQSGFETRHARDHVPRPDVLLGHLIFVHTG